MRGYASWNYKPYLPPDAEVRAGAPYLCRLIPRADGAEVSLSGAADGVTLYWREYDKTEDAWQSCRAEEPCSILRGLEKGCEYQIYAADQCGRRSHTRRFLTGDIPWTVVNYLHPEDGQYDFSGRFLCSPSLVRLENQTLLMSCDLYAPMAPQNLTLLFRSLDEGKTWHYLTDCMPCFWSKLFCHRGDLYMLGMSTEYGDVLIGKSTDGGATWTEPKVLLRGAGCTGRGWHRAPCTLLHANGRIYTSLEYGAWGKGGFAAAVLSADEDADLMQPESWTVSDLWNDPDIDAIEGNLVCAPNGDILDILRYKEGEAAVLKVSADGKHVDFQGTVPFPMAHTKFEILQSADHSYVAVGNPPPMRNVLSVYTSKDLKDWKRAFDVIDKHECDAQSVGFQYPSVLLEGDAVLIASRTAYHGADSFHNNNYLTFHRVHL